MLFRVAFLETLVLSVSIVSKSEIEIEVQSKKKERLAVLHVKLPVDEHRELKKKAKRAGKSLSRFVRESCAKAVVVSRA
jgi:hypothetical protein